MQHIIDRYSSHEGTVKISGSTVPKKAAMCANHFLEKKVTHIDFLCIGANANQQATKSMGVFRFMFERTSDRLSLAFSPLRVQVMVKDGDVEELRDATVWRTVVIGKESIE